MESGRRTFYLGRYNCVEQLGTGPLGDTYRAKIYGVAGFEKQFAVKRLHAHLSADEPFLARFVPVASAFAQLEHQRIARVHEVNAQGSQYYIVIDLVRGLDLRRILDLLRQRGEALAPDLAMLIASDIAEGLEYTHARTNVLPNGVLHLGLTAQSVMVTYEGEIKLVDVGLLASLVQPGWSADDNLAPTLAYLSPEELRGDAVDGRADLFSLGVVLHELLTGSRLFVSDRAQELRVAIESGPPPPPPADPRLQQIVSRALHPDRDRRFRDAAEMRAALQEILAGRGDRARAELSSLIRRLAAPRERRTGAFAAVTLPPPVSETVTPVGAPRPPPIPSHAWAPPAPKPPNGPMLSSVRTHNTLAGLGADDAELTPIELIELPGLPTEKGMLTLSPEEIENTSVASGAPAGADTLSAPAVPADGWTIESVSQVTAATPSTAESPAANLSASETPGSNGAPPSAPLSRQAAPESSWSPPVVEAPPPSPEPVFAEHRADEHVPVEKPSSPVPGVKLPPPEPRNRTALAIICVLLVGGAVAIYAGLNGGDAPKPAPYSPTTQPLTVQSAPIPAQQPNVPASGQLPSYQDAPPTATIKTERPALRAEAPPTTNAESAPAVKTGSPAPSESTPPPRVEPSAPTNPTSSVTKTETPAGIEAEPAGSPSGTTKAKTPPTTLTKAIEPPPPSKPAPTPTIPNAATSPGMVAVGIVTTPPGGSVYIDGEPQGTTPAQVNVTPGKHHLVIAAEHQKLIKREVTLNAGEALQIALEPALLPLEIAGPDGLKVRCKTQGELRILVDGADSGVSCPNDVRISVKAGTHKIGLYSPRTDETYEVERNVVDGNNSTRVYTKY